MDDLPTPASPMSTILKEWELEGQYMIVDTIL